MNDVLCKEELVVSKFGTMSCSQALLTTYLDELDIDEAGSWLRARDGSERNVRRGDDDDRDCRVDWPGKSIGVVDEAVYG